MEINWLLLVTIAAPIVALFIGAVLDRLIERKPSVSYYIGYVSAFRLKSGIRRDIYTHSIVVVNNGKKKAKGVRIGHSILPQDFNIYPRKEYKVKKLPDNGKDIIISSLVPGEQITISYLYFPPVTWDQVNTSVMYDDGFGKKISVLQTRQLPKWQGRIGVIFLLLGVIAFIYLLYEFFSRFIKVVFLTG